VVSVQLGSRESLSVRIGGRHVAIAVVLAAGGALAAPISFGAPGSVRSAAGRETMSALVRQLAATRRVVHLRPGNIVLSLPRTRWGRVIPAGFLGVGVEYQTFERYAGGNVHALDPVFEQLIRNLSPGQSPQVRIGGDTSDWSWWPVPGSRPPPGTFLTLTPRWVSVLRSFAQAVGARLIMGINLKADNVDVAVTMGRQLLTRLGTASIEALELGNEPNLFRSFGGYPTTPGSGGPPYNFEVFLHAFTRLANAMPPYPLAGPAFARIGSWRNDFGTFLSNEPLVKIATVHGYALAGCETSVHNLLASCASYGMAHHIVPWVRTARAIGVPLRVDEMNVTPCPEGALVMRRFAESLWALRVLFEMAEVGADGVNMQTTAAKSDDLFTPARSGAGWQAAVQPEYYGLLMFARAAPPGARLVSLSQTPTTAIQAWATRAPDGTVRVVLINLGAHSQTVAVNAAAESGPGTLERLDASSLTTQYGITLGGQTFGSQTATGRLAGRRQTSTARPHGHDYLLSMPAHSAAMLTLGHNAPASA
jgi:Glycosyl hydrolase family 30 beta sandwich domain